MTDCPRNVTKDEMIAGLKAGRTLNIDRRDTPELPELTALRQKKSIALGGRGVARTRWFVEQSKIVHAV
jgi:hypothetical protein